MMLVLRPWAFVSSNSGSQGDPGGEAPGALDDTHPTPFPLRFGPARWRDGGDSWSLEVKKDQERY